MPERTYENLKREELLYRVPLLMIYVIAPLFDDYENGSYLVFIMRLLIIPFLEMILRTCNDGFL